MENIQTDVRFTTKNAFATFRMVDANLGIAIDQKILSQNWKGNVKTISLDPPQYVTLGISPSPYTMISPAAKQCISFIQKAFA